MIKFNQKTHNPKAVRSSRTSAKKKQPESTLKVIFRLFLFLACKKLFWVQGSVLKIFEK